MQSLMPRRAKAQWAGVTRSKERVAQRGGAAKGCRGTPCGCPQFPHGRPEWGGQARGLPLRRAQIFADKTRIDKLAMQSFAPEQVVRTLFLRSTVRLRDLPNAADPGPQVALLASLEISTLTPPPAVLYDGSS